MYIYIYTGYIGAIGYVGFRVRGYHNGHMTISSPDSGESNGKENWK